MRLRGLIYTLIFFCQFVSVYAQQAYQIKNIKIPENLSPQVGGMDFLPDGRLIVCFMRGETMTFDPKSEKWQLFAKGLQGPLGLLAIDNNEVLVMQLPELTRIKDTDGDGVADSYENAADDFGISGNYHEFNYGPVKDSVGNIYFALNAGSSSGGAGNIRTVVRGKVNPLGREGNDGRRQMFSVVPYRGWVMKLSPDGEATPFASGFRSPNGMGVDLNGNIFVTDNQSDWVETSTLYHLKENHFYGHPASLVWKKGWENRDPFNAPISELDGMRTKAAVLFPQGIMANSPSQPLVDASGGKFGPFAGQLFVGEMNRDRIVRVMLEEVAGELQGACIPFIDGQGLNFGNNRLAFDHEGNLWVGQIKFGGWVGHSGIQKIEYTGNMPMEILTMSLTKEGFDLTFTQSVNAKEALTPANYKVHHYKYEYKKKAIDEGIDVSTQVDLKEVDIEDIQLSEDRKKVSLKLADLKPGYVYELKLENIRNSADVPLANTLICYTLNNLLDSSAEIIKKQDKTN